MTDTIIPLHSIIVGERLRRDLGNLTDLDTISEVGLIQPLVLQSKPDGLHLIAGGRRLTKLKMLGFTELHHGVTCDPLRPGFVFRDELPDDVAREIELYENIGRKQMDWKERATSIAAIHKIKMRTAALDVESWGTRETGAELGVDYSYVAYSVKIAERLADPTCLINNCEGFNSAMKWLAQEREDDAKRQLASMSMHKAPSTGAEAPIVSLNESTTPTDRLQVSLGSFLHKGKMELVLPTLPMVDHIITDWPYGIDMDMLQQDNQGMNVERVAAEHDQQSNLETFGAWLGMMYSVLKPNGYCITWCELEHWNLMTMLAKGYGFKVQRWPLNWVKTHPTLNQAAQYNFTKRTEIAMVLRKGDAMLTKQQPSNYWVGSRDTAKIRFNSNAFAKPVELWKWIIEAVAQPGSTILDPFAGCGSCPCAAIELGMKVIAVECSELHFPELVLNVQNTYTSLTKGKVDFV